MKRKIIGWLVLVVVVVLGATIYWRYYFVFATGTKSGMLNTFQQKGYVFKTYEGNIIQGGFRANVQSNEFDFSVTNPLVAKLLLDNSGLEVRVHYQRYLATLPWRGANVYIVDSVYEIRAANGTSIIQPR